MRKRLYIAILLACAISIGVFFAINSIANGVEYGAGIAGSCTAYFLLFIFVFFILETLVINIWKE